MSLQDCKLWISKLICIPERFVIGIMSFLCVTVAYTLRVCLNIAITQMVVQNSKILEDNLNTCPDLGASLTHKSNLTNYGKYNWDEETQGIILGSFFYGYVVTHIPGALIAEKYGAKQTLGVGLLITALLTLATPVVVRAGGDNPTGLIILRVVEGLGEGPTMPAIAVLMSRWVTSNERGFMGSLIFGGASVGNSLGALVSGFVMATDGNWPCVFYIFGIMGVTWFILWQILVYSDPRTHPYITDKEKEYLESSIEKKSDKPVPWNPFLRSLPLWAVVIAAIGNDWGYFTIVTDLPKYMNDVLRLGIKKTGMLAALPYLVMWLTSFVFGAFCDWCIRRNYWTIQSARKVNNTIASMGSGIFILLASYAGCNIDIAVLMFCIAMGLMGAYYCGVKVNALDLTPNYAGTATALINGTAAISGIIIPYLVGYLAPDKSQGQWRIAFWIVFVVLYVTNLFYLFYAEGEEQWWNDIEKNDYPSGWHKEESKR